jgi:ketosteroid isomerase-like protein
MRKTLLIVCLTALAAAPFGAQERATPSLSQDEEDVRRREKEVASALLHKDFKAVDAILADSYVLTEEDEVKGKSAVLDELRRLAGQPLRSASYEATGVTVRILGTTAVVTGRRAWSHEARGRGGKKEQQGRYTNVWVSQGGHWVLLASHVSRLDKAK